MKVVLINTSDTIGGAAIAAKRLMHALHESNVDVKLLVQEKNSRDNFIEPTSPKKYKKNISFLKFAFERFLFYLKEKDSSVRFAFSIGNIGENIENHPLIREADIIHLHWINGSFLSLSSLNRLMALNKPIVWTFHDMWAFTGGCHYAGDCINYQTICNNCPYLKSPGKHDLSNRIWKRKRKLFDKYNFTAVTCSNWLKEVAKESSLMSNKKILSIQNPININIYKPLNKIESRSKLGINSDKKLILFGAMNTNDKRKGSGYLIKALDYINNTNPEILNKVALVVFGKNKTPFNTNFETINLNFISNQEDIVNIYNACDVFVTPSIEDNLPNTIVEAHACGLPVVAFDAAGMSEMILHRNNGYLAKYKSHEDLSNGILWTLFESDYESLCHEARIKAMSFYSPKIVSEKYIKLYKQLLDNNDKEA